MAKKEISGYVKLQIKGGQANPAPPVGPALGQRGINIMEFCKAFNEKTKNFMGKPVPVVITVYKDKKFDFIIKSPPASHFIKEAAKLKALEKKKNEAAEIATGRAIHAKILSAPKPGQMQQLMRTRPGMETGTLMTRGARRTIAPRPGQTRKQVESAPVLGRLTPEKMRAKAMQDMITNRASSTTRGADIRMAREALKEQQAMLEARKAALRNIREGRALKASIKPKPLSTTSYVGGAQAPVTIPTMPSKATAFSPVKREPIPGMRDFDKHPIKLRFLR